VVRRKEKKNHQMHYISKKILEHKIKIVLKEKINGLKATTFSYTMNWDI
jgi:hypothetical protein